MGIRGGSVLVPWRPAFWNAAEVVVAHSLEYSALRNALVAALGTRGEQHRVALAVGDRVFTWYTHLASAYAELCDAASISVGDSLLAPLGTFSSFARTKGAASHESRTSS